MQNTIGKRLRQYRKSKGYRAIDFAALAGISQGSLSGIENDKSKPSSDTLASLVLNTDINIKWLLTGECEMLPPPESSIGCLAEAMLADEDPEIADLLESARRVLTSGNPIAFDALERNIRYFDHAVATEKRLEAVEAKLEELMKVLAERTKEKKRAVNE